MMVKQEKDYVLLMMSNLTLINNLVDVLHFFISD